MVPLLAVAVWLIPLAQCSGLFSSGASAVTSRAKMTKIITDEAEQTEEELKEERELEKFDLFFVVTTVRYAVTKFKPAVVEHRECCKDVFCHDVLSRGPPLVG